MCGVGIKPWLGGGVCVVLGLWLGGGCVCVLCQFMCNSAWLVCLKESRLFYYIMLPFEGSFVVEAPFKKKRQKKKRWNQKNLIKPSPEAFSFMSPGCANVVRCVTCVTL